MRAAPTLETPAWQTSPEAWKSARGIHTPWIAEISPMQYAHLPASQRRAYDAKRRDEWSASAEGYAAWKAEVMAAFDAGAFDHRDPTLDRAVREAVSVELMARDKAAAARAEAERRQAVEADHWTRETAKPGVLVWTPVYGWMRIRRCNPTSATLEELKPRPGSVFAPRFPWAQCLKRNPSTPDAPPPAAAEETAR